jgi:hypothetical protein
VLVNIGVFLEVRECNASGREIGGDDDVLDFLFGHSVDVDLTGNQRRSRPLAFSTPPFCHEA